MSGRKMERYANPSTSSSTAATTMLMDSNNDDPYSLKLERLDILNIDDTSTFMTDVIEQRKSLYDDARLMTRLLGLDQYSDTINDGDGELRKKKIKAKKKKTIIRRYNIDDDDDQPTLVGDIIERNDPTVVDKTKTKQEGEATTDDDDDDDNDEELANPDSMEEDNDYMDSYFDNGEDFID